MEQISNEFLLEDRLQKIKQIIDNYGEDKFSTSFSGGKDSTVLSALLDEMRATKTYDILFALERVKPIIEADKE